jgi:hypothetical protein
MDSTLFKEDHYGPGFQHAVSRGTPGGESAVLTMRSLRDAVKAAPYGKGMACVEAALHDKGFEHLRTMLQAGGSVPRRGVKEGTRSLPCSCGKTASFKRRKIKTVLSSVGHLPIDLHRRRWLRR